MQSTTDEFKMEMERILARRRREVERRSAAGGDADDDPSLGVWGDMYHLKPAAEPAPKLQNRPVVVSTEAAGPVAGSQGSIQRIAKVLGLDTNSQAAVKLQQEEASGGSSDAPASSKEPADERKAEVGEEERKLEETKLEEEAEKLDEDAEAKEACREEEWEGECKAREEQKEDQKERAGGEREEEEEGHESEEVAPEGGQEGQHEDGKPLEKAEKEKLDEEEQEVAREGQEQDEQQQQEGEEEQEGEQEEERQQQLLEKADEEKLDERDVAQEEQEQEQQQDEHQLEQQQEEEEKQPGSEDEREVQQEEKEEEEQHQRQEPPEEEVGAPEEAREASQEERQQEERQTEAQDDEVEEECEGDEGEMLVEEAGQQQEAAVDEEEERPRSSQGVRLEPGEGTDARGGDAEGSEEPPLEEERHAAGGTQEEGKEESSQVEEAEGQPQAGGAEEVEEKEDSSQVEEAEGQREAGHMLDEAEQEAEGHEAGEAVEEAEEVEEEPGVEAAVAAHATEDESGPAAKQEEAQREEAPELGADAGEEDARQGASPEKLPAEPPEQDPPQEEPREPRGRHPEATPEEEATPDEEAAVPEEEPSAPEGTDAEAQRRLPGGEEATLVRYGEEEQRLVQALYSEAAKREGFICPVCYQQQRTGALLLAHYFRLHHAQVASEQQQQRPTQEARVVAALEGAAPGDQEGGEGGIGSLLPISSIGSVAGGIGSFAGSVAYKAFSNLMDVVTWPNTGPQEELPPHLRQLPGAGDSEVAPLEDTPAAPPDVPATSAAGSTSAIPVLGPSDREVEAEAAVASSRLLPFRTLAAEHAASERGELGAASPSAADFSPPLSSRSSRLAFPSESAIWQSVLKGDLRRLQELADCGALTSGRLQDNNAHSIFWNAVAFHQPEVALWLLQRFPPHVPSGIGVELSETHASRGDSLLHLTASLPRFTPAAAELFWTLLHGGKSATPAPLQHRNRKGQNFVHTAADHLNFWILHSVLSSVPDGTALFLDRDREGHTPPELLLRQAAATAGTPRAPAPAAALAPEAHIPEWWPLPRYLPRGCWGAGAGEGAEALPFADVWLEVQDSEAKGGIFRAAAHRAILAASSQTLHKEVKQLGPGEPLRIDAGCCQRGEAVMLALRFLYGGDPRSVFAAEPADLWQLWRLCLRYSLPRPLAIHARAALMQALSEPRGLPLLPSALEAADELGLSQEEAAYLSWCLLSQPAALERLAASSNPKENGGGPRVKALTGALLRAERHVLEALEGRRQHWR